MNRYELLIPLLSLAFVSACGSSALPIAQMATPRQEISAAEEVGAAGNPQAALHLKFAKDQVAEADRYLKNGDEGEAQLSLMRATADAKLSLEIMREDKALSEAAEVDVQIEQLHNKTQSSQ